jgi:hypothetical protein
MKIIETFARACEPEPAPPLAPMAIRAGVPIFLQCGSPVLAHRARHGRRPQGLLTEGTPAAGVMRPIINICDDVPHVGDRQRWRPVAKVAKPGLIKPGAPRAPPPRQDRCR